jgi:putative heme iron utilization protein
MAMYRAWNMPLNNAGVPMIDQEPKIKIAILQNYNEAHIYLNGEFSLPDGRAIEGQFNVRADKGLIGLINSSGTERLRQKEIKFYGI